MEKSEKHFHAKNIQCETQIRCRTFLPPSPSRRYPAVVFTLRNCKYCTTAMKALDRVRVKYEVVLLSDRPDKDEVRAWCLATTGKQAIPRVFIGGKCIGGGSDAEEMADSGELLRLAEAAGALKPAEDRV